VAEQENTLRWDPEKGSIHLARGGKSDRAFLMRKGFMDSFFDEILKVEGKDVLSMTIRKILEKTGGLSTDGEKPTVETLVKLRDGFVLPLSAAGSTIPDLFTHADNTREFVLFGSSVYFVEMVRFANIFKEVTADILTPRGARAIIRAVGRRAGMTVGDAARANYSWTDIDSTTAALDQQVRFIFPLMGWGNTSVSAVKGADGNYLMYYRCMNTFEADGVTSEKPTCIIFASFLEGISESIALALNGQVAECHEVRCAATGSPHCAFAVKLKEKGSPPIDWAELEGEWAALDT
jgi:predicted hydrocarbon binding protein